jgi:PPK2 family polyphosphate:nucleotide phosphotransferase
VGTNDPPVETVSAYIPPSRGCVTGEATSTKTDLRDLLRARPVDGEIQLAGFDPRATPGVPSRKKAEDELAADAARLATLQEMLYANGDRSVLLVLQGLDTSGKDGTIKHVIGAMNPVGVRITSFKVPTEQERRHSFLWRIRHALPAPGQVAIFNRSHYEDVGVVRVHGLAEPDVIERRYAAINRFEREVAESGTTIVKCWLHISYDEQRKRLLARLDDPAKRWKFSERDIEERRRWADYMAAYETAIARCSTDVAPWYVVPADRKWYRNFAVARLLVEHLDALGLTYPVPDLDVAALKERLAPPH